MRDLDLVLLYRFILGAGLPQELLAHQGGKDRGDAPRIFAHGQKLEALDAVAHHLDADRAQALHPDDAVAGARPPEAQEDPLGRELLFRNQAVIDRGGMLLERLPSAADLLVDLERHAVSPFELPQPRQRKLQERQRRRLAKQLADEKLDDARSIDKPDQGRRLLDGVAQLGRRKRRQRLDAGLLVEGVFALL